MILAEITIHEEPAPYVYTGTTVVHSSGGKTEKWKEKFPEELEKAKTLYQVGDTVTIKTNTNTKIVIESFIETVDDSIQYMGDPCVIVGRYPSYVNASPIKYCLKELDHSTIVPAADKPTIPLILVPGALDAC